MKIDILTLFPDMFKGPFDESILQRAQDKSLVEINIYNLRDWSLDKHKTVDDRPYGGGKGMILRVDIIANALSTLGVKRQEGKRVKGKKSSDNSHKSKVVLLSPQGKVFSQKIARGFSKLEQLILICGHYEGVDQRVADHLVDEEISIGEYVLTGGELPAMIITDTIVRLLPGVLTPEAIQNESFSSPSANSKLPTTKYDFPQYTRPPSYNGWKVPDILLSGNHKEIENWRHDNQTPPKGRAFKE